MMTPGASNLTAHLHSLNPACKRVLITGGTGYLAGFLLEALLLEEKPNDDGVSCREIAYTYRGGPPPAELRQLRGARAYPVDLTDPASLRACFDDFRPDAVVHTAAVSNIRQCEADKDQAHAVNCPEAMLDALEASCPSCLIIFLSTDQVFAGRRQGVVAYQEEAEAVPCNEYGRSKLAFEGLLATRWPAGQHVTLRSSNMIGPASRTRARGTKFLQWLEDKLADEEGGPAQLFADEIRSYIFVEDICRVIGVLLQNRRSFREWRYHQQRQGQGAVSPAMFLMGGPEPLSREDVGRRLCRHRHYDADSRIVAVPRASVNVGYAAPLDIRMDSAKLVALVGGVRMRSVDEALAEMFPASTKTCRNCHAQFGLSSNGESSCRVHPESYSGETAQRWLAPGQRHDEQGHAGADVVYFWTCCGESDPNAPGCQRRPHASYDDDTAV